MAILDPTKRPINLFQINLNGNIIANTGFINRVGQLDPETGKYVLTSSSTALWGALQSL